MNLILNKKRRFQNNVLMIDRRQRLGKENDCFCCYPLINPVSHFGTKLPTVFSTLNMIRAKDKRQTSNKSAEKVYQDKRNESRENRAHTQFLLILLPTKFFGLGHKLDARQKTRGESVDEEGKCKKTKVMQIGTGLGK